MTRSDRNDSFYKNINNESVAKIHFPYYEFIVDGETPLGVPPRLKHFCYGSKQELNGSSKDDGSYWIDIPEYDEELVFDPSISTEEVEKFTEYVQMESKPVMVWSITQTPHHLFVKI